MNAKGKISYILFDAANTLIHKPTLWDKMLGVLQQHQIHISPEKLKYHHKLLSEYVDFPDRTSREFYAGFNRELLLSFGIIPSDALLEDIFSACTYMPWERFEDTHWLNQATVSLGVISNFNNNLPGILQGLFGEVFKDIIVSEQLNIRKPDTAFYEHAIKAIGLPPEEILYIGDSLKLDIIPARQLGLNVRLIDRLGIFRESEYAVDDLSKVYTSLNN